ncbi:MAG: AAA family ATPase, partial [Bacteroidales bacterium]|nr:AAA family ATPase [Bacteroidales bacterium]
MYLNNLSIINFKNIREAELSFSPGVNCFFGKNGVGKTNLLDAIYYLSFCKSHSNPIDSQNINHDADFFVLQAL